MAQQHGADSEAIADEASTSKISSTWTSSTSDSELRSTLLRTPSQTSFTSKKARLAKRNLDLPSSLSHQDLTSHAFEHDADDLFSSSTSNTVMPKLIRHTTYSSLPPSPRITAALDFGVVIDGVHPDQLEHALHGISLSNRGSSDEEEWVTERVSPKGSNVHLDEVVDDVEEVEEEFWPARSRRHTLEHVFQGNPIAPPRISRRTTSFNSAEPVGMKGTKGIKEEDVFETGMHSPTEAASSGDEKSTDLDGTGVGKRMGIAASLWDILKDEGGEEVWEGWVADGKWYVKLPVLLTVISFDRRADM